ESATHRSSCCLLRTTRYARRGAEVRIHPPLLRLATPGRRGLIRAFARQCAGARFPAPTAGTYVVLLLVSLAIPPEKGGGQMDDTLRLELPALSENVARVRSAVAERAEAYGLAAALVADLKTVVSEACANVVLHAYAGAAEPGPLEV